MSVSPEENKESLFERYNEEIKKYVAVDELI